MGTIAHSLVTMIFCVGALAVADGALAVLVPGKKLLIKIDPGGDSAKNKLVFLVKSPDVQGPATASQDPTVGGGTFRITGPGVTQFGLAAADWKVNAAGTVFKYKGSFCRAKLKPGVLLRAACHGPFRLTRGGWADRPELCHGDLKPATLRAIRRGASGKLHAGQGRLRRHQVPLQELRGASNRVRAAAVLSPVFRRNDPAFTPWSSTPSPPSSRAGGGTILSDV